MIYQKLLLVICLSGLISKGFCQVNPTIITGNISGEILDADAEFPIPLGNITLIKDSNEVLSAYSDEQGHFVLENVEVGRYDIKVTVIGYETKTLGGVLVTSGKTLQLNLKIKQANYKLEKVVVRTGKSKQEAKNSMATVSARQLSMEEANRFAGGFDDPARLVSSYAGVAAGGIGSNGIVVRGNAPKGILWRMEGVPIPNPNHFAEVAGFGAGGITALSSRMLDNSDFFTSAFPAEYGNALSGVFDLSVRKGNRNKHEHSLQASLLGVDMASEGPLKKGSKATYLANYRYSTLGLLDQFLPGNFFGITYQDLAFKLHIPSEKAGTFSIWGLGLIDGSNGEPDTDTLSEESKWKYNYQLETSKSRQSTGIVGFSNQYWLKEKGYIKTTLTGSGSNIYARSALLDSNFLESHPNNQIDYTNIDLQISSLINYKFNAWHTNRSGVIITISQFDFTLKEAPSVGRDLITFAKNNGESVLLQAYTQSSLNLSERLLLNGGIHFMYLGLNNNYSIEPRLGLNYKLSKKTNFSAGYGLHSQLEKLSFYLANVPNGDNNTRLSNKNLELGKAHHFVLGFDHMITSNSHLRIEPYFQYLYDIPVIDNHYFSMLNLSDDFFINDALVNKGTGTNIGTDITLERFLNNGWYYLSTLSIFDSKYTGGDGIERNSRFNRNYLANLLLGKEWTVRKKNLFSASIKYTYMAGDYKIDVDEEASLAAKDIILNSEHPYESKNPDSHIMSITFTYRVNKKKHSNHWSLQILNALGAKEHEGFVYNFRDHEIEKLTDTIVVPNLSYKLEF